ncbi:hypothetical protein [Vulcanisaeta distributa]|uniref:hypothetical protein n=1 Tax=Vulcanisaeta distributa TaxID=164451 RepID=UPI000B1D61AF|nr:hypothetical protein [Vulcanisaeta distributa]
MLNRLLDRVRVFGVGDLPIELRDRPPQEVSLEYLPTATHANVVGTSSFLRNRMITQEQYYLCRKHR